MHMKDLGDLIAFILVSSAIVCFLAAITFLALGHVI
jgi:hypothetical protein